MVEHAVLKMEYEHAYMVYVQIKSPFSKQKQLIRLNLTTLTWTNLLRPVRQGNKHYLCNNSKLRNFLTTTNGVLLTVCRQFIILLRHFTITASKSRNLKEIIFVFLADNKKLNKIIL